MTHHYYLLEHPTPAQWAALQDWALARAQMLEVMRYDVRGPIPKPLRPFQAQLIDVFVTCYYWDAPQIRSARFFRLALNDALRTFVRTRAGLSDWEEFSLPVTDPAFYQDDIPILWTITHEGYAFLWLDDEEAAAFRAQGFVLEPAPDVQPPVVRKDSPCKKLSPRLWLYLLLALIILPAFFAMAYYMIVVLF